ncbi:MAG: site-specific DNA-methyltransferase, partial [Rhizobiales bacterium]|nr:site-specific DNA-methyltransferase [Hyphomicrobiales bacterium]
SGGGSFRKTRTYLNEISDEGLADGFELDVFYVAERLGIQSLVTFYSELQEDIIYNYFKAMYFDRSIPMFWKKTNPTPFANKSMQADLEFIRFGWSAPFYPQGEYVQKSRAYVSSRGRCVYGHPTEKPVELMRKLVINASRPDFVVLDPFMGSGTTGEACMREGRKFIGIEHNKDYFDMAVKRISAVYAELECEAV